MTSSEHDEFIRESIAIAKEAVEAGNHPFGSLLVAEDGYRVIARAQNSVTTEKDVTAHAERNLVSIVSKMQLSKEELQSATLYTSTEPCAMCAGAIAWLGVKKIVYGTPCEELKRIANGNLALPCRIVFEYCKENVTVIGPILQDEAKTVHENFWN